MIVADFLICLLALSDAPPVLYKHFIGDREAGSLEVVLSGSRTTTHNRLRIERMGSSVEQTLSQEITLDVRGSLKAKWTFDPASARGGGQALWMPEQPNTLSVSTPGKPDEAVHLDPKTLLWPPDIDAALRRAALDMSPLNMATYSFASLSVSRLDIIPESPDPMEGFPDTVRFRGTMKEGASVFQITSWISPSVGQVKQISSTGGLIVVTQRAELAPPSEASGAGFFEWSLRRLPRVPLLAWRKEICMSGLPDLTESAQQKKIGSGEFILSRAVPPNAEEAEQPPVGNKHGLANEDARCLADSPLLGLYDTAIDGLLERMKAGPDAPRWELACNVNSFVFDFIRLKGLEAGFATAPEVVRNPRGDCTEHTVLMVALLRRLGVPSRAVFGWAGLDDGDGTNLGLHAWVEVKIGQRWIPFDPTFGQAPAGAFRIAIGTSELDSYANLGWDLGPQVGAALSVSAAPFEMRGNLLAVDDLRISASKGVWVLTGGELCLDHPDLGQVSVSGNIRRLPEKGAKLIRVGNRPPARYTGSLNELAIDCGKDRWLYIKGIGEGDAAALLRELTVRWDALD